MRRHLAVVNNDDDGVMGDNDDGRDGLCRRRDGVVALVTMASYDDDSTTGDEVDDNGNGVRRTSMSMTMMTTMTMTPA